MSAPSLMPRVAIVAEESALRRELENSLSNEFNIVKASGYEDAYPLLEQGSLDVIVLDVDSGDHKIQAGLDLLEALEASDVETPVIVISDDQKTRTALRMVGAGAYDFLVKPVNPAVLKVVIGRAVEKVRIERENRLLRQEITRKAQVGDLLGSTDAMRDLFESIKRVARSNATVAIRGESGSGKELVARAIHDQSARRDRAFVSVNCAALPETLMESELFGYEKGAFTGATATKEGRIEAAHHGTLFLDEIGTLGLSLQSKLLRILEDQTLMRLGGKKPIRVDFRLITATNEDLEKAVKEGRFREDLYYRIHVVPLFVPPLRERADDIPSARRVFCEPPLRDQPLPSQTRGRRRHAGLKALSLAGKRPRTRKRDSARGGDDGRGYHYPQQSLARHPGNDDALRPRETAPPLIGD